MLVTKVNPVGMDFYIQNAQRELYKQLLKVWGEDVKYNCYGRCYRNKIDKGYIAEVYSGKNEYKEVYWDDALAAISFFGLSGSIKNLSVQATADVHLVFFVDLKKLALNDWTGTAIAHRSDEEVRKNVLEALGQNAFGLSFQSIDLWIENVLKEYPGSRRDDRLKTVDMHPVHCFRLNYTLNYNPNKIC